MLSHLLKSFPGILSPFPHNSHELVDTALGLNLFLGHPLTILNLDEGDQVLAGGDTVDGLSVEKEAEDSFFDEGVMQLREILSEAVRGQGVDYRPVLMNDV